MGRGGSEHRCRRRAPEASQTGVARGDTAGGEERGAEPHLYISRDEAWHGTVACACVGATRAHAATYPRMQQRRVSLHVFNKPQATPHSVQAGTMHVAAITSAADEASASETRCTRPYRAHPAVHRPSSFCTDAACASPAVRSVCLAARGTARPISDAHSTLLPRPRTAKATQHSPQQV